MALTVLKINKYRTCQIGFDLLHAWPMRVIVDLDPMITYLAVVRGVSMHVIGAATKIIGINGPINHNITKFFLSVIMGGFIASSPNPLCCLRPAEIILDLGLVCTCALC